MKTDHKLSEMRFLRFSITDLRFHFPLLGGCENLKTQVAANLTFLRLRIYFEAPFSVKSRRAKSLSGHRRKGSGVSQKDVQC